MRITYIRLLIILVLAFSFAWGQTDSLSQLSDFNNGLNRPKIGLVLSGGGARGFAHIGTLKMLDSLGIPIDYIAGTSMGGIIGALYAIGYDGKEIEQIALEIDWTEIFTDQPPREELPYFEKKETGRYQLTIGLEGHTPVMPAGLIKGQKVFQILSKLTYSYQSVTDFKQFPIPFSCVAVDIVTGNEVVLDEGSLAYALRATMSIPTVFSPVEWGDSLLIDGGILDNLPVDVARWLGADIIIAVNVGTPKKEREELNSIISILEQTVNLASYRREEIAVNESDILISPDLNEFSSTDFEREEIIKIIRAGDLSAAGALNGCLRLQDQFDLRRDNIDIGQFPGGNDKIRLHGISLAGNTTIPFQLVYDLFELKPGDFCTRDTIDACIANLKKTGYFKEVKYEIRAVSDNQIRLIINVKEKEKPKIHGISIKGNDKLPFRFIYDLLGIKPGTEFDPDKIDKHITELYGLGYFENIYYEIQPLDEGSIRLIFIVKEKPRQEMRFGFRFDDNYNFIGIMSGQATNFLIPGLRIEDELQLFGLTRLSAKIFYPSRTLDFPIYPFLRLAYKDVSMNIIESHGKTIATYPDRSWLFAGGVGILIGNFFNAEFEFNIENMNVEPEVAFSDPTFFPTWRDKLRKFQASFTFDILDDPLLPTSGLLVKAEAELSDFSYGSEVEYFRYEISGDLYYSLNRFNTFRLYGFWSDGDKDMPVYKRFYRGGPLDFVGADYHMLVGYQVTVIRTDYRRQLWNNIYATFIGTVGKNVVDVPDMVEIPGQDPVPGVTLYGKPAWMYGFGLSLIYDSPVGPIQLIYGHGLNSAYKLPENRDYFFFTGGYNF